ncbi:hypothetical protein Ciccas_006973 [Cichlidogyrus casuarinus]|uniref:CCAAT-binding factor domain-containing protein n=1 Tax=Cichlidogyrus casuarinus TaxID=1844966 RepID=A0ABD2Q4B8_9PLAT
MRTYSSRARLKPSEIDEVKLKEAEIIYKKFIPEEYDVSMFSGESKSTREWLSQCRNHIVGIVVNKLGDRDKRLVSELTYKLSRLGNLHFWLFSLIIVKKHRRLILSLVASLQEFLFRPHLPERACCYAINLLTLITFPKATTKTKNPVPNHEVATKLVKIYTSFFNKIANKMDIPERLVSSILIGLKRAIPYIPKEDVPSFSDNVNAIFRLVHTTVNFKISLQALSVLFLFGQQCEKTADRFYTSFYRKMLDPDLRWSISAAMFLQLFYHAVAFDTDKARISALVQRALETALHNSEPSYVIALLLILDRLRADKLKEDSTFDIMLRLSGEAANSRNLELMLDTESEDEHFSDAPVSDEEEIVPKNKKVGAKSSWIHVKNSNKKQAVACDKTFDYTARDPRSSNAQVQFVWPLLLLAMHAHPTVSLFAGKLLAADNSAMRLFESCTSDPFEDYSLARFLERFCFKKPKPKSSEQTSLMCPAKKKVPKELIPGTVEFSNMPVSKIPSDQTFIHK